MISRIREKKREEERGLGLGKKDSINSFFNGSSNWVGSCSLEWLGRRKLNEFEI